MPNNSIRRLLILLSLLAALNMPGNSALSLAHSRAASPVQYDDPYSDFRNVRYSNAGLLSESDEIKLGAKLHREVTKKFNLTDSGLARVTQLGQRVAKQSLRPNFTYKFHVIENREINGFSIPGGHVYVTTALVRLASDNELASVLAHEVGHVVARHSLKTLKQSREYDDVAKSLGDLTGVAGNIARDLGIGLGKVIGEGFLTIHTRDQEREADFLGVHIMSRAGFDGQGMITMFQKLQRIEERDASLLGSLFADHPDAEERIENTRYEISRMRRRN